MSTQRRGSDLRGKDGCGGAPPANVAAGAGGSAQPNHAHPATPRRRLLARSVSRVIQRIVAFVTRRGTGESPPRSAASAHSRGISIVSHASSRARARLHCCTRMDDPALQYAARMLHRCEDDFSCVCLGCSYDYVEDATALGHGISGTVRLARTVCRNCADCDAAPTKDCAFVLSKAQAAQFVAIKEARRRRKDETPQAYVEALCSDHALVAGLDHAHVMRTLALVCDGSGRWYMALEHCPGGDLFALMQAGGIRDPGDVDSAFRQLVDGVAYLHSQGIVHRDLKPENLLVDRAGRLRIADFGGACPADRALRGPCGSAPYIPPEAYSAAPYDGRAADVWAMGIIYYALNAHAVPWCHSAVDQDTAYAEYIEAGPNPYAPFARLLSAPRALVRRMLQPDPALRASVADVVADDWLQAVRVRPLLHASDRARVLHEQPTLSSDSSVYEL